MVHWTIPCCSKLADPPLGIVDDGSLPIMVYETGGPQARIISTRRFSTNVELQNLNIKMVSIIINSVFFPQKKKSNILEISTSVLVISFKPCRPGNVLSFATFHR